MRGGSVGLDTIVKVWIIHIVLVMYFWGLCGVGFIGIWGVLSSTISFLFLVLYCVLILQVSRRAVLVPPPLDLGAGKFSMSTMFTPRGGSSSVILVDFVSCYTCCFLGVGVYLEFLISFNFVSPWWWVSMLKIWNRIVRVSWCDCCNLEKFAIGVGGISAWASASTVCVTDSTNDSFGMFIFIKKTNCVSDNFC